MSSAQFATLGLSPIDKHDASSIRQAYKKRALLLHPDKNPNNLEGAKVDFQHLQDAYEKVLESVAPIGAKKEMSAQMKDFHEFMAAERAAMKAERDAIKADYNMVYGDISGIRAEARRRNAAKLASRKAKAAAAKRTRRAQANSSSNQAYFAQNFLAYQPVQGVFVVNTTNTIFSNTPQYIYNAPQVHNTTTPSSPPLPASSFNFQVNRQPAVTVTPFFAGVPAPAGMGGNLSWFFGVSAQAQAQAAAEEAEFWEEMILPDLPTMDDW